MSEHRQRVPKPPSVSGSETLPRLMRDELRKHADRASANAQHEAIAFRAYAEKMPTAKREPLDFARFPFQRELYDVFGDLNIKDACAMKAIQVGVSELLARLTIYFPDTYAATALYVFPALKQMRDFSDTRINGLREQSPYLRSRTRRDPDWPWNKGLKRFGDGHCYYRGSESRNDLLAVDADLVALDEYDSLDARNIPDAEGRVSASRFGLIRRVGVPTDPEWGIAARYERSDKRQWHARCESCRERQPVTFDGNVDEQSERIVCRRCRKPIDVAEGEWVAEHPDRDEPGFHVHQLLVPRDPRESRAHIRRIIDASKRTRPEHVSAFFRHYLGLPYADSIGGLDRAALAAAVSAGKTLLGEGFGQEPSYNGPNLVTAGIDVASARNLHVRISEHLDPLSTRGQRKRALFIGEAPDFGEVARLLERYGVNFACIDQLPDYRLAHALAQNFPGCVYVVRYGADVIDVDTESHTVAVSRVLAMDATIELIRMQRNLLPPDLPPDYVEHMVANRRRLLENDAGPPRVQYNNGSRADDYFQAEVYDLVATEVARIRMDVEERLAQHGELVRLEDYVEFQRSQLGSYDDVEYSPGPPFRFREYGAGTDYGD